MADWSDLIGLSLDEAIKKADKYKHKIRVVSWNGSRPAVTRDYRGDRVNVEVERPAGEVEGSWKITKITGVN